MRNLKRLPSEGGAEPSEAEGAVDTREEPKRPQLEPHAWMGEGNAAETTAA